MQEKVRFLLNQSNPPQARVQLLDKLTISIKNNYPDSKEAHQIWRILKQDHYFWYFSSHVLQHSQIDQTKVFMLVILEDSIKQKWCALPIEQRDNLKSYIVNVVLQYGAIQNLPKSKHNILSKANAILVQIVKYQWNTTWTTFINDICAASLKDMNICQNNFFILKMLSEEIFDYSKNQMTQQQILELKTKMNQDFTTIYQLCNLILQNMHQAKPSLLKACLETLNAFLSWIPLYYISSTDLIDKLINIIASDFLRNYSIQCLVEIASLQVQFGNEAFKMKQLSMLKKTTIELNKILPLTNKEQMPKFLSTVKKNSRHAFQILSRQIVMFYSQFFKAQLIWLKQQTRGNDQLIEICRVGLKYIIMLMQIQEDQVFKISIEFFHFLLGKHLQSIRMESMQNNNSFMGKLNSIQQIYPTIFNQVMQIITLRMAKPQEVLIIIDETGYPVREELQNTENSSLYEIMKQLISYLATFDWNEMKKFILSEIQKQNGTAFSFDILNSLSWVVGSLCGSILQKQQKQFFISTLRTLLHLCEFKKGKENKAVIASCIMYVVGEYPTFLRNNWTFLKTVVRKLFQFMKQDFPGIMEMACNAFLKIAKNTAEQFVMLQQNDSQPYIHEIIQRIPQQTKKLNTDTLKLTFYQSVGYLISAEKDSNIQLEMMKQALGSYFYQFHNIIKSAEINPNILREQQVEQKILYFLKINQNLAIGVGQQYVMILEMISQTINKIYLYYSSEVNTAVITTGKHLLNFLTIKIMRAIKKQIIRIYINYLQKCSYLNNEQAIYILNKFIFPLGTLLKDFQECLPETKQQQFVMLFTLVLQKLNIAITSDFLTKLLDMIFSSSLPLITTDFNSFPEIRGNFFAFLKALIKYNFQLLYSLDKNHFSTILDCVIWSFRHELSNYSDLGLQLIEQILSNVNKSSNIANAFYPQYHIKILTQILDVMTDGFHKSGLQSQSKILYVLIHVVSQSLVTNRLYQGQHPNQSNYQFLFTFLTQKLSGVFVNISKEATSERVDRWFKQVDQNLFREQIEDYLIVINRYTAQQVKESITKKLKTS